MADMDLTTMSLALSAILFSIGVAGVVDPPQRDHPVHVHRADAERGEPGVRRVLADAPASTARSSSSSS
jgi:hypothetical protein